MEQWATIRRRVLVERVSKRRILRETGMHWTTLEKILDHNRPPGYRMGKLRERPKLGPFCPSPTHRSSSTCRLPVSAPEFA